MGFESKACFCILIDHKAVLSGGSVVGMEIYCSTWIPLCSDVCFTAVSPAILVHKKIDFNV